MMYYLSSDSIFCHYYISFIYIPNKINRIPTANNILATIKISINRFGICIKWNMSNDQYQDI